MPNTIDETDSAVSFNAAINHQQRDCTVVAIRGLDGEARSRSELAPQTSARIERGIQKHLAALPTQSANAEMRPRERIEFHATGLNAMRPLALAAVQGFNDNFNLANYSSSSIEAAFRHRPMGWMHESPDCTGHARPLQKTDAQ